MSALILLAEDHEANRKVLCRRLERRGYKMLEAADGEEAVTRFQEQTPDLVLMDLSMPIMDGVEALKQIRKHATAANIPIVALTAHAMDDMRSECAAAGFDDFATKPIDFEELLNMIRRLIPSESLIARSQ